jgi:hypothetical protein
LAFGRDLVVTINDQAMRNLGKALLLCLIAVVVTGMESRGILSRIAHEAEEVRPIPHPTPELNPIPELHPIPAPGALEVARVTHYDAVQPGWIQGHYLQIKVWLWDLAGKDVTVNDEQEKVAGRCGGVALVAAVGDVANPPCVHSLADLENDCTAADETHDSCAAARDRAKDACTSLIPGYAIVQLAATCEGLRALARRESAPNASAIHLTSTFAAYK